MLWSTTEWVRMAQPRRRCALRKEYLLLLLMMMMMGIADDITMVCE